MLYHCLYCYMTLPKQVLIKEKLYWWDGWMASPIQWTWVWASSRGWWWTGKPGVLPSMGSQRVGMTEQLNWTECHFGAVGEFLLYNHGLGACLVAQPYPTLCDPIDCSSPGSSVHRIMQARILVWVAIHLPRGSSWHRDQTRSSALQVDSLLPEPLGKPNNRLVSSLVSVTQSYPMGCSPPGFSVYGILQARILE